MNIWGTRDMRMWSGKDFSMRNFIVCTIHIIVAKSGSGMEHVVRMEVGSSGL